MIEDLGTGHTLVATDVFSDPRIRERRPAHQAMDTRSLIVVPLVRQERLQALLYSLIMSCGCGRRPRWSW